MKIVIDIKENDYNDIQHGWQGDVQIDRVIKEVGKGTPIKQGKWIDTRTIVPFTYNHIHKCSLCGWMIEDNKYLYCPNCGAKMVEPQESEDKEVENADSN